MAALFTAPVADAIYLLEVAAQPPTAAFTTGRSDFGDLAWGEPPEPDEIEQTDVMLRYASAPWRSWPSDTPANRPWEHRLLRPLQLARALPLAPNSEALVGLSLGEIELANADHGLDTVVQSFAVDGRRVTVKRVRPGASYASAAILFSGAALGWRLADDERAVLSIRGQIHLLNWPLQRNLYSGAGGGNGDIDLANLPRPLCFGYSENVTPVLVSALDLLFQVNDGPIEAIADVYDGAVLLTAGANHASLSLLMAATPASGHYDTCLAEGYFRLGSNPVYDVTCDVEGDKTGGTFATDTATIARRMLIRAGFDPSQILDADFAALTSLQPAPVGYYVAEPAVSGSVIADILAGIGAFLGETADGRFTVARLEAPTTAADTITEVSALDISIGAPPEEVSPCAWRIGVCWAPNWTPQAIQLDAANVPAPRRAFINQPFRVAVAFDTNRFDKHRLAQDHLGARPPVRAFFRDEPDAAAEAARLMALWSPERQVLALSVQAEGPDVPIGQQILLKASRYGLDAGAPCRVFGFDFDAATALLRLQVLR